MTPEDIYYIKVHRTKINDVDYLFICDSTSPGWLVVCKYFDYMY